MRSKLTLLKSRSSSRRAYSANLAVEKSSIYFIILFLFINLLIDLEAAIEKEEIPKSRVQSAMPSLVPQVFISLLLLLIEL